MDTRRSRHAPEFLKLSQDGDQHWKQDVLVIKESLSQEKARHKDHSLLCTALGGCQTINTHFIHMSTLQCNSGKLCLPTLRYTSKET